MEETQASQKIAQKAIKILNSRITDEVFMIIQEDRKLMHSYLRAVQEDGLDAVNQTIGRVVKEEYGLKNSDHRQKAPRSTLIQSHQQFE